MSKRKSILDIVTDYGIEVKHEGDVIRAFCPFHNDTGRPNFTIYPETDSFYCFACVLGTSKVITPYGMTSISDLKTGDKILGKNGEFKSITQIKKKYADNLLEFNLHQRTSPLVVTADHKMLVFPSEFRGRSTRINYKKLNNQILVEKLAENVTVNDFMCTPKLKFKQKNFWYIAKYFRKHNRKDGGGHTAKIIPNRIKLSEDLLWLIGLFIAEGSTTSNGRNVCFTLHRREISFAKRVLQVINKVFNLSGKIYHRNNRLDVVVSNVYLADVLSLSCGTGSCNKRIPVELFPIESKSLIQGILDGDGHIKNKTQFLTTTSEELHWQVYHLLVSFNKSPVITKVPGCTRNGVSHKPFYIIQYALSGKSLRSKITKKNYLFKVCTIKKLNTTEVVYDLSVDGSVFVVDGVLVHNCKENGNSIAFVSKMEGISYSDAKKKLAGEKIELEELREQIDGIGICEEPIKLNEEVNILVSKELRKALKEHPQKTNEILQFSQEFDKKLQSPIYYNEMQNLIKGLHFFLKKLYN